MLKSVFGVLFSAIFALMMAICAGIANAILPAPAVKENRAERRWNKFHSAHGDITVALVAATAVTTVIVVVGLLFVNANNIPLVVGGLGFAKAKANPQAANADGTAEKRVAEGRFNAKLLGKINDNGLAEKAKLQKQNDLDKAIALLKKQTKAKTIHAAKAVAIGAPMNNSVNGNGSIECNADCFTAVRVVDSKSNEPLVGKKVWQRAGRTAAMQDFLNDHGAGKDIPAIAMGKFPSSMKELSRIVWLTKAKESGVAYVDHTGIERLGFPVAQLFNGQKLLSFVLCPKESKAYKAFIESAPSGWEIFDKNSGKYIAPTSKVRGWRSLALFVGTKVYAMMPTLSNVLFVKGTLRVKLGAAHYELDFKKMEANAVDEETERPAADGTIHIFHGTLNVQKLVDLGLGGLRGLGLKGAGNNLGDVKLGNLLVRLGLADATITDIFGRIWTVDGHDGTLCLNDVDLLIPASVFKTYKHYEGAKGLKRLMKKMDRSLWKGHVYIRHEEYQPKYISGQQFQQFVNMTTADISELLEMPTKAYKEIKTNPAQFAGRYSRIVSCYANAITIRRVWQETWKAIAFQHTQMKAGRAIHASAHQKLIADPIAAITGQLAGSSNGTVKVVTSMEVGTIWAPDQKAGLCTLFRDPGTGMTATPVVNAAPTKAEFWNIFVNGYTYVWLFTVEEDGTIRENDATLYLQYDFDGDSIWIVYHQTVFRKSLENRLANPISFILPDGPRQDETLNPDSLIASMVDEAVISVGSMVNGWKSSKMGVPANLYFMLAAHPHDFVSMGHKLTEEEYKLAWFWAEVATQVNIDASKHSKDDVEKLDKMIEMLMTIRIVNRVVTKRKLPYWKRFDKNAMNLLQNLCKTSLENKQIYMILGWVNTAACKLLDSKYETKAERGNGPCEIWEMLLNEKCIPEIIVCEDDIANSNVPMNMLAFIDNDTNPEWAFTVPMFDGYDTFYAAANAIVAAYRQRRSAVDEIDVDEFETIEDYELTYDEMCERLAMKDEVKELFGEQFKALDPATKVQYVNWFVLYAFGMVSMNDEIIAKKDGTMERRWSSERGFTDRGLDFVFDVFEDELCATLKANLGDNAGKFVDFDAENALDSNEIHTEPMTELAQ